MDYEPHVWVAGETITPSKLNHLEQGVANSGGTFIVEATITETEIENSGSESGGVE